MNFSSVSYQHQGGQLEGQLGSPVEEQGPLPTILLFHEYMGLGDYLQPHVKRLIMQGCRVFLADIYGVEVRPRTAEEASQAARIYRSDRRLLRARAQAALELLQGMEQVDNERIFALGFSFGGCAALELARSGAALAGIISVYGHLNTPLPADSANIVSDLLVIHGACDPVVWNRELVDFLDDMGRYGIDCQAKVFTDAGHGFCNASLTSEPESGNYYSTKHDTLAWEEIARFLDKRR